MAPSSVASRASTPLHAYVSAVTVSAIVTAGASAWLLARDVNPRAIDAVLVAGSLLVATLLVLLHRYPVTLYWREHRIVVSFDEAAVFLGLLLVPASALVPITLLASVVVQWWFGPRAMLKRVFNVAQYGVAAAATAGAFGGLSLLGVPQLAAASAASLLFGQTANMLLAGVFARLDGVGTLRVFRERFLIQGAQSAIIGLAGSLTIVGLWRIHPLALLAVAPFVVFMRSYGKLYATADREIDVHRRLASATHDLVGTSSVSAVCERVITECERLLDCGMAEILVEDAPAPVRLTREFGSGPQRQSTPLVASLPARRGGALGEIRVWPRLGKDAFADQERELLRTMAGQAASALENARAIAETEAARQRLATYLANAQDAVMIADLDGRMRFMNPAARALFGVAEGEVGAVRAADFFDDPTLSLAQGHTPQEAALVEAEARDLTRSRLMLVEAHAGPLIERGETTGVLMIVRDVTERKRLEDETTRQREALAQSEKLSALGTLMAGVAHEINNPLTFMRGNLQLSADLLSMRLAESDLSEEQRAFLKDIDECLKVSLEGVDRISGIATSLKNVARRGPRERRPEDVNRIVDDVISVVRTGIPRSVRLELDLARDLPLVVAQASELHQVLLNLVKNSVEALGDREGGFVRVRSFLHERFVHLEVADNGCGIPAEVQRSLFQPFFTTKTNGTGLGLSISRGIAQKHGGDLSVASELGEGTTFTLTLPIDGGPAESAAETEHAPEA